MKRCSKIFNLVNRKTGDTPQQIFYGMFTKNKNNNNKAINCKMIKLFSKNDKPKTGNSFKIID